MTFKDARQLYGFDELGAPDVSEFVGKIPKGCSIGSIGWKTILSVVEMKRKGESPVCRGVQDADQQLDEEPDASQPTTSASSATLVSTKRSASAAGVDGGAGTSGNKRRRVQKNTREIAQSLATQAGTYAAEKFSDSFSVSHVLNLLVRDELLWISWVDREGAIFSSAFNFIDDLPLTFVLLLVLQRFGRRQWGHISELAGENQAVLLHPMNIDGTLSEEEEVVNFHPDDKVHSGWSLLGRATTVVGASTSGEDGNGSGEGQDVAKDVVIGDVFGEDLEDIQRTQGAAGEGGDSIEDRCEAGSADPTEDNPSGAVGDLAATEPIPAYRKARDAYREAYNNTAKAHNLVLKVSWPEASRPPEWEIIGHAQTLGKNDKFIGGHIPVVDYAREFDRYSTHHIREFLDLPNLGTRALRLTVMKRLRPVYDLDGKQFWDAFWQCVACHHRLWVNGIHHGDISFNNLMYDFLDETGNPVGIVNDYDLATWVDHSATNSDRTGTIPFMAIDLLDGGLDRRIPRLYRHDMESFVWVLAYITIAKIEYNGCAIKISPPPKIDAWFRDGDQSDRDAHISSKQLLHSRYGHTQRVYKGYYSYLHVVREIIRYWVNFHQSLQDTGYTLQPLEPGVPVHAQEEPGPSKPEVDDPSGSLKLFITTVEKSLGEGGIQEGFVEMKGILLEAAETPTTTVPVP